MRAYSTDLRERIVRAVASGRPQREAARTFGVGINTVKRYLVRQQETGSLERRPIPGGVRRIGKDQEVILLARLEAAPDATLAEHCAWWVAHQGQAVSVATMCRALHRLGWTHKKSRWPPASATQRHGPPGARRSPSATRSSLSSSMKAAPTRP
jgi:transposase